MHTPAYPQAIESFDDSITCCEQLGVWVAQCVTEGLLNACSGKWLRVTPEWPNYLFPIRMSVKQTMASSLGFTNYHGGRTLSSQASAWPGLLQSWAGAFARTPLLECIVRCPLDVHCETNLCCGRPAEFHLACAEMSGSNGPGLVGGGIRFTCSSTKVLLFFPLLLLPLP